MNEREALLAGVCARMSSPTPKLVFADWLDEHGECGEAMRFAARKGRYPLHYPGDRVTTGDARGCPAGWMWRSECVIRERMRVARYLGVKSVDRLTRSMRHAVPSSVMPANATRVRSGDDLGYVVFPTKELAWNAFIVAFGLAMARGKIGKKRSKTNVIG